MLTTDKTNLSQVISERKNLLGIYFSAGYPYLECTADIIDNLESNGVDFIEVGMPYSDPLADGPVIEACHAEALKNGMTINTMFSQLSQLKEINTPLVLMGYFNPVYKYGIENFLKKCKESGIKTLILPDLPVELYVERYKALFDRYDINLVFLITPTTPDERLRLIDRHSKPFIYLVSSSSTTGKTRGISTDQAAMLRKVKERLETPVMVGFGISTHEDYKRVTENVDGAIVGSAFLKALEGTTDEKGLKKNIEKFIRSLKGKK